MKIITVDLSIIVIYPQTEGGKKQFQETPRVLQMMTECCFVINVCCDCFAVFGEDLKTCKG